MSHYPQVLEKFFDNEKSVNDLAPRFLVSASAVSVAPCPAAATAARG